LVADAAALRDWSGASDDAGDDYTRACSALGSGSLVSLDNRILVWDFEGAGTAFLTRYDDQSFQLVRFWPNRLDDDVIQDLIQRIKPAGKGSTVHITASPVVVVWACEDTRTMSIASCPSVPKGDWSMGGTVYCFPVKPGTYLAETGSFESVDCSAASLTCTLSAEEAVE
jgi:hypothetical protein